MTDESGFDLKNPARREGIGNGLWVMGEEMRRGRRCWLKVLGSRFGRQLGTGNWERGTVMGHKMHKAEGCGS
jgi:hypothetical protein